MNLNNNQSVGRIIKWFILLVPFVTLVSCGKDDSGVIDIPVTSISIKGIFIEDGGSTQLTATVLPDDATIKEVEWFVSNAQIATIDQNGLLTAVSNGIVTVTASATDDSNVSGTKSINISGVEGPQILIETISIQASNITDGQPQQLNTSVLPSNASNKEVTWSVSDESIAKISASGLLSPIEDGTITVTATATDASGVTGTKQINITGASTIFVQSITVSGADIADGSAQQFSAEVFPENANNKEVSWSVSNEGVATISSTGLLTPAQNGSVIVTASALDGSGVTGQLTITISGVVGIVVSSSSQILSAISNAQPGDLIYITEGNYEFSSGISLSRNGQTGNLIRFMSHPSNTSRPVFDFSAMSENSSNRGINLSGDYWHIKGIEVYKAGDNGMFISGSNNLIEFSSFYENADTGLQIGNGGANNTVLNCDSYYNADSSLENADGFAAKLDCGGGNKFIGCRAWNNLDDGWDGYLRGADNITTYYENCWAFRNGYLKDGTVGAGDGNGFKTGGSDDKLLKHNVELKNCITAGNVVDGFDHNSNRGNILIYNSAAHSNGRNFSFGTGNIAGSLVIKNSISLSSGSNDQLNATSTDITNNGWQDGINTTSSDFSSIDIELLLRDRNADGSLPDINYLHLIQGSDLIDAGVDVGLDFNGSAPDLGAFEFE